MKTKNRVKELRVAKGHDSQREFANFITNTLGCPVSYATISKLEKQTANPTWEIVDTLAGYFGVTTDYLMGRTNQNLAVAAHTDDNIADDLPPEAKIAVDTFYNKMRALYGKNNGTGENN
ncbi:helix-turn-helix domain-containing protein [Selenomonas ruminantium]|uniref:helix-turn-helix domain-containing protein n=1 Tax=Selenomonas ruminantium TaxID=971 RepID=UPI0026EF2D70|nr:helix-turn-helix transcriptional regulator [Selenomonas ruminantium]